MHRYSKSSIVLFEHTLSTKLGDIYFHIQNYNYEAKRTRDASERFNSSAEPYQHKSDMETLDHKNWRMAKERREKLSINLVNTTKNLICELIELGKNKWFNEERDDLSN